MEIFWKNRYSANFFVNSSAALWMEYFQNGRTPDTLPETKPKKIKRSAAIYSPWTRRVVQLLPAFYFIKER